MGTGMIGMQWIIFIGIAVVSWLVQMNLQSKFKKYSKIPTGNGMTGADVALKMLHDNGIYDVTVTHTPGHLTDHYNPANKTVNLSEGVYNSNSIMAAAVAAHECGHAVQACTCLCPADDAQQIGSGGFICFQHHDLGAAGRYSDAELFPAVVAGRYYPICHDYVVQLHHPSGGNQCKQARIGVAEQFRHHELL